MTSSLRCLKNKPYYKSLPFREAFFVFAQNIHMEVGMSDNLLLGLAVGFMCGALLVHSNQKASEFIDDGKQKIMDTLKKI